jgi:glycogen phosphorylase
MEQGSGAVTRRSYPSGKVRTMSLVEDLKAAYHRALLLHCGRFAAVATRNDHYLALAYAVRDRLFERWMATGEAYYRRQVRSVAYLSAEFLLGPHLGNNLLALGLLPAARTAMSELGLDLDDLLEQEEEPGLGNGGLGRLAACYLDSLATLQIPSIGYGIRYEFGIFDQGIRDGWQVELTDKWLHLGNPWEMPRPEIAFDVKLGGHTESGTDPEGRYYARWVPARVVRGVAYDTPIAGNGVITVNLLRLWKAEATESFDFEAFNKGDYWGAVDDKVDSENITKVLYPNDEAIAGRRLRLEQQYFFVSCSLQDILRLYGQNVNDLARLHEKWAVQLNDTHPAIGVAELMRLLVDERGLSWDDAWAVTSRVFGYTNHTLLPEALETWPVELFRSVLPRHLEIIFEINHRFLDEVRARFPGDEARVQRMSLIDEAGERRVRMANLASVGSKAINGVARLHTELLQRDVLHDFYELWPEKFSNKTNGVTPRRFVELINPGLTRLVTEAVGEGWVNDLDRLRGLEELAGDAGFRDKWRAVKRQNKRALVAEIARRVGTKVDEASLFDVQVKRIHEYKRQHLNVLHVIAQLNRLRRGGGADGPARTVLFAGKAAPGYRMAKLIIKLIHAVGAEVDRDPAARGRLKVVFVPDYNVKNSGRIFPAADLSEQISTAGKEASGTGNMKLALNGALTIGTLDGANVEIREEVGEENFFLFGLTADEVTAWKRRGYRPRAVYEGDDELREALDQIAGGKFSDGDRSLFLPLVESLLGPDPFMVLADFRAYVDCQRQVEAAYADRQDWTRKSILNTARMGKFSSDRSIREYCDEIWRVGPEPVTLKR